MLSSFSRVWLFLTLWTVARQAPLSMGISRQEYWSGLPFPPPRDLPDPGTEPTSRVSCIGRQIFTTSATFPLSRLRPLLGLGRWERDGRLNDGQHWGWGLRDAEHLLHWQLDSLQLAPPEQPLKTWVYTNSLIQMEGMIRNCLQYPPLFTEAPR